MEESPTSGCSTDNGAAVSLRRRRMEIRRFKMLTNAAQPVMHMSGDRRAAGWGQFVVLESQGESRLRRRSLLHGRGRHEVFVDLARKMTARTPETL
jgi:hypothetical protein